MSQLTIYLDDNELKQVKKAARREQVSVSRWARERLSKASGEGWPKDYFKLFGSLSDTDFERPDQGDWSDDIPRKAL